MKHKSKNKGKGFTETEREAQLSSQVFVLSELLDMTSTIIEELRTDNDCLVDENNDYSELVCSLHRKIKKLKRKISRQQEGIFGIIRLRSTKKKSTAKQKKKPTAVTMMKSWMRLNDRGFVL